MTKKPRPKGETHAQRVRRERGASSTRPTQEEDYLTPSDILSVLREDVLAVGRAADLRIRELTIIATEYARGEITPQEANERFYQYTHKWRDAIVGVRSVEGLSDDDILKRIDDYWRLPSRR